MTHQVAASITDSTLYRISLVLVHNCNFMSILSFNWYAVVRFCASGWYVQLDQSSSNDLRARHHHQVALHAGGLDFSTAAAAVPVVAPLSLMDRRFMPSPPPAPSTPSHGCSLMQDPGKPTTTSSPGAHHWTFEEQFKQVFDVALQCTQSDDVIGLN